MLRVFDSLQIRVWPHGGFHCHCSDLGGRSLSCLFPPHFPALQFEAEASAEVGLSEKKKRKRKTGNIYPVKKNEYLEIIKIQSVTDFLGFHP